MLDGTLSVSHAALDEHDCGQATAYFRARLVHLRILPFRDEGLARFDRWCYKQQLSTGVGQDRQHLAAYVRWRVRPALSRRAKAGTALPSTYNYARQKVRVARNLLCAMHERGVELAALTQDLVDEWLDEAPSRALAIRAFLGWAHTQNIIPSLSIQRSAARASTTAIDHERRIAHARRLIEDATIAVSTRVAGLLLLLYGQHMTRIVTLRATDVQRREGNVLLMLGAEPIRLAEPLASMVADLHDSSQGTWLFRGARAGTHIHAASMRRRLQRQIGITTPAARAGALLGLAAQVPGPVLAELLGYCNDTASHWRREASGDWARYVSLAATSTVETDQT